MHAAPLRGGNRLLGATDHAAHKGRRHLVVVVPAKTMAEVDASRIRLATQVWIARGIEAAIGRGENGADTALSLSQILAQSRNEIIRLRFDTEKFNEYAVKFYDELEREFVREGAEREEDNG